MIESELKEQKITVAQALAIYKLFQRNPIYWRVVDGEYLHSQGPTSNRSFDDQPPIPFEEFVRTIQVSTDCVMVQWCGMWLGIEADGYTHS